MLQITQRWTNLMSGGWGAGGGGENRNTHGHLMLHKAGRKERARWAPLL